MPSFFLSFFFVPLTVLLGEKQSSEPSLLDQAAPADSSFVELTPKQVPSSLPTLHEVLVKSVHFIPSKTFHIDDHGVAKHILRDLTLVVRLHVLHHSTMLPHKQASSCITGHEHTYVWVPWLTQWAMDILSHTGAAVILRDQACWNLVEKVIH